MGTNTTPRGYRYPDGNAVPALDVLLGQLASDVDTDMTARAAAIATNTADIDALELVVADSGLLAVTAPGGPLVSLGTGVSIYTGAPWTGGLRFRRWGKVVQVTGAVSKTTWVTGDIVLTLAAGWRPGPPQQDNRTFGISSGGVVTIDAGASGAIPIALMFLTA